MALLATVPHAYAQDIHTATPLGSAYVTSDYPDSTYTNFLLIQDSDRFLSFVAWESTRPRVISATLFLTTLSSNSADSTQISSAGWFDHLSVTWNNQPEQGFIFQDVPLSVGVVQEHSVDVTQWWNDGGPSMKFLNTTGGRGRFYGATNPDSVRPRIEYVLATPPDVSVSVSSQAVELPSGNTAVIAYEMTVGDVFIVGVSLAVLFVLLFVVVRSYADRTAFP